jgi:hypothetical protein
VGRRVWADPSLHPAGIPQRSRTSQKVMLSHFTGICGQIEGVITKLLREMVGLPIDLSAGDMGIATAAIVQIPIHRGHLLRFDRGQATDLMAATLPI